MNNTVKWTGAIVLSLLAHTVVAKLLTPDEAPVELALIEGGEAMEVTVLGNAFEQTLQAGNPDETVEPEEVEPEEVEPEPVEMAEVAPLESEVKAETPSDIVPTEADVILPADDIPPVAAVEPEITATVAPAETVVPEEKPEQEPEPEKVEKPEPEEKPEPKKKPERKKTAKPKAGEDGEAQASQRKGQADGVENAKASTTQGKKGAFSQDVGNANMSNYDGRVRSKVNRSFRYPPKAKRERLQGVATIRFTVSATGAASNIGVAKSSGHPILDQAALEAVRKAAPFAKFPEGAGLSSKLYTLPIQFNP